jgi:hypothetical protein
MNNGSLKKIAAKFFQTLCLLIACSIAIQAQTNEFRERLLPAPMDGGFRMDGYWVWCGSVIKGERAFSYSTLSNF